MFASRFWTLLLALAAGTLLAVVILAKDQVNRERQENATAILYKELDKVDVALTLQARKRLDVLLTVAADGEIRKIMGEIAKDPAKAEKHRQKLLTTLRERNEELKNYKADILMVVDVRGEVVVQVGENQRENGYNIGGFPAVSGALRGYVRDDVWKLGNEVFMVAARPIIGPNSYVGAAVHLTKVTDKLASDLSQRVQLGFFAGTVPIAVGTPAKAKNMLRAQGSHMVLPLEKVIADKQYLERGYSEVERIETKEGDFLAIYSMIRGQAAANDVGYAIVWPIQLMVDPTEFYDKATKEDLEKLPTGMLIGAVVVAILFGWAWNWLEAERPLSRLHKQIKDLEQADPKDQLNIYRYRRKIRKVAASINRLMDVKIKAMLESAGSSSKSIDSILGKKQEGARLSSASFKFSEASADDIPDAPPGPAQGRPKPPSGAHPPIPPPTAARPGMPPAPQGPPKTPSGAQPPAPPPPGQAMSPADEQAYFRKIHQEFVDLKRKLGEDVDQLTFDRFEITLKKNRDTLVARYGCQAVRFQVYEKDGKASLKATPVK